MTARSQCTASLGLGISFITLPTFAVAQSVTLLPAFIPQQSQSQLHISGDGSTVFGIEPREIAPNLQGYQPWRWSAATGVVAPLLPTGANSAVWSSWTATGDRSVLIGYNLQPGTSPPTLTAIVNAAGVSQPFVSPIPGYTAGRLSGDGRTTLLWRDVPAGTSQPTGFALVGPSGTQLVHPANPAWNIFGISLSYDGSVVGGLSAAVGGRANGDPHIMRWSGGPTAGGPSSTFALPANYEFGSYGGSSGDGTTLFGALSDASFVYHPYLFTEATGFEFLPQGSEYAVVRSVSFDASSALIDDGTIADTSIWQRGRGTMLLSEYLAQQGIDLNAYSDIRFYDMSYDARSFVATAQRDGVYVPLLITIPEPALFPLLPLLAFTSRRRR